MLRYLDSHAHYNDKRFSEDREILLKQLHEEENIAYIVNVSYSIPSCYDTLDLCERYPFIYGAVGVHPHEAKSCTPEVYEILEKLASNHKIKAIGESGLDYHYDNSPRDKQRLEFDNHLSLSERLKLPIIVHMRESVSDTIDILKGHHATGVIHSYSGSVESAAFFIEKGFMLSFSGPVTFKNARTLREVVKYVPPDRMLIETDCPYLTPEPNRGKRNDSANLKFIAQVIADVKGMSPEDVAGLTLKNAMKLFDIKE